MMIFGVCFVPYFIKLSAGQENASLQTNQIDLKFSYCIFLQYVLLCSLLWY